MRRVALNVLQILRSKTRIPICQYRYFCSSLYHSLKIYGQEINSSCLLSNSNSHHYHKHNQSRNTHNANGLIGKITLGSAIVAGLLVFWKTKPIQAAENEQSRKVNLLLQCCRMNDLESVRKLIKDGVDVNAKHELGWSPLMVAAMNNHYTVVKLLLEAKANPNLADSYSHAARVSMESGLARNQVQKARDDEFSPLLSGSDFRGSTALHYAALVDNLDIMTALIQAGADPFIVNAQGFKPSQFAATTRLPMFKKWEEEFESTRKEREAELRRRFPLEKRLKERLVGQEGAINVVSSAVRRKENGWFDDNHPLVMLFLGSSGIGKTELAKQLASYLHGEKKEAFIRIDMSEYQSKHEAAKFIGAPPGYVGHDEGGQLTERLAKFPSAVVLFDEVDKAHPDVLATLLQLFDEGHLTDGKGKKVACKDATFIMTANVANEEISQHALELRDSARALTDTKSGMRTGSSTVPEISREFKDSVIHPILKQHFKRDEFLGRINEIVYFLPFNTQELYRLVTRQLNFWAGKANSVHKIELTWDQDVVEVLAKGFDIHYGARSIIYEVERRVIGTLASLQEVQKIFAKDKLRLKVHKGEVLVERLSANGVYQPIHG
ncbi:mitochondrial disaggregase-like isoform X1 [Watersipora subatra]|uniref:mitochondrial disaggregase-like isoform X1 n=1 Tax=Watersipora subatra TaxID=2589382 RepID=UPI00355BE541